MQFWRSKSAQSFNSQFYKWAESCVEMNCNPVSGPASDVANFLAELYEEGNQASSLNVFRPAISSAHDQFDGVTIGKHPLLCLELKGAFQATCRPPLPHYIAVWNVQTVLKYLESIGLSMYFPITQVLTSKLAMLLALTMPSRSADLAALQQGLVQKKWFSFQQP